MKNNSTFCLIALIVTVITYNFACSKSSPPADEPGDLCAGKNITINSIVNASSACASTGSITINAAGSSGFIYKLNSGAYQSSNVFNNIGAATYTLFVKDGAGCERSASAIVGATGTAGFSLNISTVPASNCGGNDGVVTINPTGSSGYSYKLNSGVYQASNNFTNLPAGSNNVTVKDFTGCEVTAAANVLVNTTAGPKFIAVRTLLLANCSASACHTNGGNQGGRNFDVDCNIVAAKVRINQRAVIEGSMPSAGGLSPANKAIITDWINAGGGFNN